MAITNRRAGPVSIGGVRYDHNYMHSAIAANPAMVFERRKLHRQIKNANWDAQLRSAFSVMTRHKLPNLKWLLPLLLNLKGEPFGIDNHFPFEPWFDCEMRRRILYKCGRQVGKSMSMAAQGIIVSNAIPYFNTLYVTPLYEMIRRFSTNYVRGFIDQSPVRNLLVDTASASNVLQRSFRNHSKMFFSFAFLSPDRIRGLDCSKVGFDEVQDLDPSFIPIIRETMSGSTQWGLEQFTGSPKTFDGTVEILWLQSSRAEWHILCQACNYENIPSLDHDLEKMIGPNIIKREVSESSPGVVCANCGRPIFPRLGRWVHHSPELRREFPGYHVPQIIMPMHYADPEKWAVLLGKRSGVADNIFFNEVCGESYDTGAKLITITELRKACTNRPNSLAYADGHRGDYVQRICSVDWGGGGEKEISFTTVGVLGLKPDGKIDVLYGWRSRTPHDHVAEAEGIIKIMAAWRCTHLVHDFGGAGEIRETILIHAGVPAIRMIPIAYDRASVGAMMRRKDYNPHTSQRMHYRVDKARSLVLLCDLIRHGWITFFAYDYKGVAQSGLVHDFLGLTEDMVDSRLGGTIYTVIRSTQATNPDDFAQMCNIGMCAHYWIRGKWPDMKQVTNTQITKEMLAAIEPAKTNWNEFD